MMKATPTSEKTSGMMTPLQDVSMTQRRVEHSSTELQLEELDQSDQLFAVGQPGEQERVA